MTASSTSAVPLFTVMACRSLYTAFRVTFPLGIVNSRVSLFSCSSVRPSTPVTSQWLNFWPAGAESAVATMASPFLTFAAVSPLTVKEPPSMVSFLLTAFTFTSVSFTVTVAVVFFSLSSTLTALLAAVLNCISASVLSASAGAERVNIMHPASAADTARRISLPCFMVQPPFPPLAFLRGVCITVS